MHLIELHRLSDISLLQAIYKNINHFNLLNQLLIIYTPDLKKKSYKIPNLFYHILKLNFEELLVLDEATITDIIFDLIELDTNIILHTNGVDQFSQKAQMVKSIMDESGMKYIIPHRSLILDKEIDLKKLSYNDLCIVKEIFNQKNDGIKFSITNFLFRYRIDELGDIFFQNENIGNVERISIARLLFTEANKKSSIIHEAEKKLCSFTEAFSFFFYEPWLFFIEDIDYLEEIKRYKYKIYNSIKSISPYQYPEISGDIVDILNKQSYVQMNDILDLMNGKKREGIYVSLSQL